ncbi:MAG: hypothetical protein RQ757_00055 [Pseudomonadales bacterium]|nr:hypothetical protein [Pseudomonadales bacterium]
MMLRLLSILFPAIFSVAVFAQSDASRDGEDQAYFRNQTDTTKFMLVITGAAASEEIRQRFQTWAFSLQDVLVEQYAYAADNVILLMDDGRADDKQRSPTGSSRRNDIEKHLQLLYEKSSPGDQVGIFLIGHGSGSATGSAAKFNIVGPDITGTEFAGLLENFRDRDMVIINTSSASFEFTQQLAGIGRVLVSATRSRAERFDPVFAGYFIEALADRKGDRDKNNRVSVLEALIYAQQLVAGWYEEQGRLATEHAVLDDNGDGMFVLEPGQDAADGSLAEIAYFDTLTASIQKQSQQAQQLQVQMQELEREIFLLRNRKADFLEQDYWNRLEALLIDLALTTERYNELP